MLMEIENLVIEYSDNKEYLKWLTQNLIDDNRIYYYNINAECMDDKINIWKNNLLIAKIDNQIIGAVYYTFNHQIYKKGCCIDQIYIDTNYRQLNIGTKLLEKVIIDLKNREIQYVNSFIAKSNIASIKLFKKFKFKKTGLMIHGFNNNKLELLNGYTLFFRKTKFI